MTVGAAWVRCGQLTAGLTSTGHHGRCRRSQKDRGHSRSHPGPSACPQKLSLLPPQAAHVLRCSCTRSGCGSLVDDRMRQRSGGLRTPTDRPTRRQRRTAGVRSLRTAQHFRRWGGRGGVPSFPPSLCSGSAVNVTIYGGVR